MIFGQDPPASSDDPAFKQPCYKLCNNSETLHQLHLHACFYFLINLLTSKKIGMLSLSLSLSIYIYIYITNYGGSMMEIN
jgi:hypothetical protein